MKNKQNTKTLDEQFNNWFIEYGSHVVLNRAVPHISDGLKPSQRRVLHAMEEMEDGRYNKVANIVGNTLKYHPHGDMSVFETLVGVAQKDLLIDKQGNWGNILTGDGAAAGRYIEARLSKLGREILFNKETTEWTNSYDGRNKEPVTLPVKFPLLLAQGTEGIAVSLSCKILPHNFNELCDAAISYLSKEDFRLYPDFPQGGLVDVSEYNDGQGPQCCKDPKESSKVRIRAVIKPHSKYSLEIVEIPWGTSTISLRDSILDAESKGRIKIKKVHDMTAQSASIIIEFPAGPDYDVEKAKAALYKFTDAEVLHYPNAVVIQDGKPNFTSVSNLLVDSVKSTKALLKKELEIEIEKLDQQWMKLSLEALFIEKKAYKEVEDSPSPEESQKRITKALKPHWGKLRRVPTGEEILNLTELKIRRISKYDKEAYKKELEKIEEAEKLAMRKLSNMTKTTINYFKDLKERFGKDKARRSKIIKRGFVESVDITDILPSDKKVYCNRPEGFIGTGLRKDEELPFTIGEKTDIAAIGSEGVLRFNRPGQKTFYGLGLKEIVVVAPQSQEVIYNMIYNSPSNKNRTMAKRFTLKEGFIRDREYLLCGKSKGEVVYLEKQALKDKAPKVKLTMKPGTGARKKEIEFDFNTIAVKGREALGNIVSQYPTATVAKREK
jgi:topoisomerase-4 subunit A